MTDKILNMPDPTMVAVSDIIVGERLRPVSDAGVWAIIESIGELGVMKDPVHVRRKKGALHLIAGGHRLEAAKQLEWATIRAVVWDKVTDDWARMMEIDDNLAGAEMTVLDTAVFLAERKRLYEKMHPQAAAATGSELVAKRWNTTDTMSAVSFARATAEKFGITDRHVRRLVEAGTAIGADSVRLRAAPRPVTLKDLIDIAKIGDADSRRGVIDAMTKGEAKSAAEAFRRLTPAPELPVKDPVEEAFQDLLNGWSRASAAAKRRFAAEVWTEMSALMSGGENA